jgi:hypothetical protein
MDEQMFHAQVMAQKEQEDEMRIGVYKAINAVQGELAQTGIAKNRKNMQGSGYMFRGIDDVYNALSPLLAKHGLCIMPRILKRELIERQSQKGGALFYVTVEAEFDFVCAEDGSTHTVRTFGEAMDSGDKATNKAMSAAYKYAAFQAFAIPTEGDNDADAQTHEVAVKAKNDTTPQVAPDRAAIVRRVADACIAAVAAGNDYGAYEEAAHITETDEKLLLWQYLASHSKVRSAIKAQSDLEKHGLSRALAQ